jgi:hypothetical protein
MFVDLRLRLHHRMGADASARAEVTAPSSTTVTFPKQKSPLKFFNGLLIF